MKRRGAWWVAALIAALAVLSALSASAASVDYDRLTRAELKQVIAEAQAAIERNHTASSAVSSKLCELTKLNIVRLMENLQSEPQWRLFDWTYEREWNQLKVITEARIDGVLQSVNAEYFDEGGEYRLTFLQVGERILVDEPREDAPAAEGGQPAETPKPEDAPAAEGEQPAELEAPEPEDALIAKRGDKNDTVKGIQQMLIRLGFLGGTADGSFGAGTEKAVKKFQSASGLAEDGMVTRSVYEKLEESAASAPEVEEVISITAKQLFAAYDANEFAADEKYEGKLLEVSGKIDSIDTDILGTPYITLPVGPYSLFSVQCYFDRDEKANLAKLKKGRNIVIRGTCDGWTGNILISDCEIVG